MDDQLNTFFSYGKALLVRAAADKKSPLRTPVLATVANAIPQQRTIVLRAFKPEKLECLFYTDIRSPKVAHLQRQASSSLLFYHPKKQFQIRISGTIEISHNNNECLKHWKNLTAFGKKAYATVNAPSTTIPEYSDGLDPKLWHSQRLPEDKVLEPYYMNFALLKLRAEELEFLHLEREGHKRARFTIDKNGGCHGTWLIP